MRPKATVFTDGACSGNPGPGGWAAIVVWPSGEVRELAGALHHTTNNRMELSAAIAALRHVSSSPQQQQCRIYTDSTYVIAGITSWIVRWKIKDWKTMDGKDVLNRDLWEELEVLLEAFPKGNVSWHYVRGHSGFPGNERCDEIAVSFSQGNPQPLYFGPLSGYPHDILRLPEEVVLVKRRSGKPKGKTLFYLSFLDGKLQRHADWSQCQARVIGKSGARFKKISSPEEEAQAIKSWGSDAGPSTTNRERLPS